MDWFSWLLGLGVGLWIGSLYIGKWLHNKEQDDG